MPKSSFLLVDKKNEFGVFRYEERISSSRFRVGVDYTVDESKNTYEIISPQLKKEILIIKNPYNENIDVSDLEMKILVDRKEHIDIKPRIVAELEQREGLVDTGRRAINDFSRPAIGSSGKLQQIEDGKAENSGGTTQLENFRVDEKGDRVIVNDKEYDKTGDKLNQEQQAQVDNAQKGLDTSSKILIGVGSGFVVLISAIGYKVFRSKK